MRNADQVKFVGIPAARVKLLGGRPHRAFLGMYHSMDVSLDTFPYTGWSPWSWECPWWPRPRVTGQVPEAASRFLRAWPHAAQTPGSGIGVVRID